MGSALLRDALRRIARLSDEIGVRAVIVHALAADTAAFYSGAGFVQPTDQPATLLMSCKALRKAYVT